MLGRVPDGDRCRGRGVHRAGLGRNPGADHDRRVDRGDAVNLEQSLRLGDELGGHLVSGHVDGLARIVERRPEAESVRFVFEAPEALMPFIAPKGSVALDGVSLTVNELSGIRFGVNIIPHTLACTTFDAAQPGQDMNLEIDMIARYVARLLGAATPAADLGPTR